MTPHVEATLDGIVEQYCTAFTRHCTCGAPECAKPTPADRHDYRVMACTMLNVIDVVEMLVAEGALETATQLTAAARRYAEPVLLERLDRDPSWMESTDAWYGKLMDPHAALEDEIREELAETSRDVGAELTAELAAEEADAGLKAAEDL